MDRFIPKPYKKEAITIRLTPDTIERIDHLANSFDMSSSAFIGQCIDFALHMARFENNDQKGPYQ